MSLDETWIRSQLASRGDEPVVSVIESLVREQFPLFSAENVAAEASRLHATVEGVGPLHELFDDPAVTDVLMNGPGVVWVERGSGLEATDVVVGSRDLAVLIERAFHRAGRSVDLAHPIGDTHLADGTRLSVVLPPVAPDGPIVALRRQRHAAVRLEDFGGAHVAATLRQAVATRSNVLIYGATGAGKTTLVAAMTALASVVERIITIEDAAELRIDHPHVVSLECRPSNSEGRGEVTLRELVGASLRLRPDRLVLGEARGPEALDVVWALASGHRGSFATVHAASALGAIERLETFVAMADASLPHDVIAAQVRGAFDLAIGVERAADGRRVTSIDKIASSADRHTIIEPVWAIR